MADRTDTEPREPYPCPWCSVPNDSDTQMPEGQASPEEADTDQRSGPRPSESRAKGQPPPGDEVMDWPTRTVRVTDDHSQTLSGDEWWACQEPERPLDGNAVLGALCSACLTAAEASSVRIDDLRVGVVVTLAQCVEVMRLRQGIDGYPEGR